MGKKIAKCSAKHSTSNTPTYKSDKGQFYLKVLTFSLAHFSSAWFGMGQLVSVFTGPDAVLTVTILVPAQLGFASEPSRNQNAM